MQRTYEAMMRDAAAYIEILIDVHQPVELTDFVSAFTSIANHYRRHMRAAYPDLKDDASVFIREIRPGSIIADLIPSAAFLISQMDQIMIVEQFVRSYGGQIRRYFSIGGRFEGASKSELNDFMGSVVAIANNPNGQGHIKAVAYEDGKREIRALVEFDTSTARQAVKEIEKHKEELDAINAADYKRVLLVFKRSDVGDAGVGVRSGERVIIESISDQDRPLIYASNLAEERIKDQMRNTKENIYHKGFVVDVNVETRGGKAIAYRVTNVHQIIDL